MSTLTTAAQNALLQSNIEPKIILEIDGVSTVYGSGLIKEISRIGDSLTIGDFIIGGLTPVDDQSDLISFESSTVRIANRLRPDKGNSDSVTSMRLRLIDKDNEVTNLITPGQVVTDLLFRKCKVWVGFGDSTEYPQDYVVAFRGYIDQINSGQGYVDFNISSTDQKKRQALFLKQDTVLSASINASQTTVEVDDDDELLLVPIDPSTGSQSTALLTCISVNDEIIQYTSIGTSGAGPNGGTVLSGCTRAKFSTIAASHTAGDDVGSYYQLDDNAMLLALKLMLSDKDQSSYKTIESTNVNQLTASDYVADSFYFADQDIAFLFGVRRGDYITSSGFTNGANNLSAKTEILDVGTLSNGGSYITVDSTLVDETATSGDIVFHSQYNVLGEGLGMVPDEVDIDAHVSLFNRFLSSANISPYIKDTQDDFKKYISEQIYFPFACYEVTSFSKSSVKYTIGPIPTDSIINLGAENIVNPSKLILERSVGRNYYNTVVYKLDEVADKDDDRMLRGVVTTDAASKTQIDYGTKSLLIEASGLRETDGGTVSAASAASRFLNRYKLASESIKNVKVLFKTGVALDVGDLVLFNFAGLNISNTIDGNRDKDSAFFEVINKALDIKTGNVTLELLDTNFSTQNRYGLIGPSSVVKSGSDQRNFVIEASYNTTKFGANEYRKWERYVTSGYKVAVRVRNEDFSVDATANIESISGNAITLDSDLGFTPAAGYIMELSPYNDQVDEVKLIYVHMTDDPTFADGQDQYKQL